MIEEKSNGLPVYSKTGQGECPARRPVRLIALALLAPFALTACAGVGGTTYGTGESQEAAIVKDVTGLFGVIPTGEKPEPIDYSARAGLVLPPDSEALPPPGSGAGSPRTIATNWPQDPDVLRKAYHERMNSMTDEERKQLLEAIRALPPEKRDAIIKNDPRSTDFASQIEEPDPITASAAERKAYEAQVKERLAMIRAANGQGKEGRQYLTQPPERFTEVTPELEREIAKIDPEKQDEGEKKGFMSKLWPF